MRQVYVVSDLHGYYDLFIDLLEKISFNEYDLMYVIGDICDRGPDSLKLLFYIQEHDNIILIKGNHEYLMHEALYHCIYDQQEDFPSKALCLWLANGGDVTLNNITTYLDQFENENDDNNYKNNFLKKIYIYLKNLPEYVEIQVNGQNYLLVHAGVDVRYSLDRQETSTLLWIREDFYLQRGDLTKTYIFGHTPTALLNSNHSFNVWFDEQHHNKIGIDGGLACGKAGQLNCLCLNDYTITVIEKNK